MTKNKIISALFIALSLALLLIIFYTKKHTEPREPARRSMQDKSSVRMGKEKRIDREARHITIPAKPSREDREVVE